MGKVWNLFVELWEHINAFFHRFPSNFTYFLILTLVWTMPEGVSKIATE